MAGAHSAPPAGLADCVLLVCWCVHTDVIEGGETAFPDSNFWVDKSLPARLGPFSPCAAGSVAFKPKKVCPLGCLDAGRRQQRQHRAVQAHRWCRGVNFRTALTQLQPRPVAVLLTHPTHQSFASPPPHLHPHPHTHTPPRVMRSCFGPSTQMASGRTPGPCTPAAPCSRASSGRPQSGFTRGPSGVSGGSQCRAALTGSCWRADCVLVGCRATAGFGVAEALKQWWTNML